ncbi:PREDICTED: glutamate-gated chloride channel-like [Priapulus caudatus]|uniref:Glutamate-gated chloride channel-like n=1 Tax=Priapulus caudatus TaxID=37621 RepID=A0ABM1DRZ4_PRICU|nr:PREDICTED: glutamate-gated chloride channel-like [Priapulus caudatus]
MNRDYEYHVVQNLMAVCILVICSWIPSGYTYKQQPARVALVLRRSSDNTQSAAVRYNLLPSLSKSIDVWFMRATLFIFLSLLEFALVNYLTRSKVRRHCRSRLFPVAFCFFLIIFWSIYSASSMNLSHMRIPHWVRDESSSQNPATDLG